MFVSLCQKKSERMRSQGLNVCFFMSDMDEAERENAMRKLLATPPEYNFLFATPETVLTPPLFELLQKLSSESLIYVFGN